MCASVTCSNGSGSGVLVPGTGVILNNMLGEEDLNPLGFHRIAPGRRVPSMMAPTVVLRDGEIELGLGSAGSNRIRSAILQTVVRAVEQGLPVAAAIEAPRLHFEAGVVQAEPGIDEAALARLEARGIAGRPPARRSTSSSAASRRSPATPRPARSAAAATRAAAAPSLRLAGLARMPDGARMRRWPAPEIDFEAEGLLDELEGEAREARLALLEELAADGVSLEELREAVAAGRLTLLPVERALAGDGRRYTPREVAEIVRHRPRAAAALQRRPRRSLRRPRRTARRPRPTSRRRGG